MVKGSHVYHDLEVCVCVCVCSVASEVKPVAGRAALSHWVKVEVHLCT